MNKIPFGTLENGEKVYIYTIKNEHCAVKIMDRGAAIVSFCAFSTEIVGGFDRLEDYLADSSHQGAIIGRVANRIANACFKIDGVEYRLPKNDGNNCLHGGVGFDMRMWRLTDATDSSLVFSYTSEDGEEGFPSELHVKVKYTLEGTALVIEYEGFPMGKTPIALTNHAYFNLNGLGDTVYSHRLRLYSNNYTAVNDELIPTGEHPQVLDTVFDFTKPYTLGERLSTDFTGYDHNFVLSPEKSGFFVSRTVPLAAEVEADTLKMNVYTDQEGIQLYMGNFLGDGPDFSGGIKQIRHGAFCLEAQKEPDAPNRNEAIYGKGEIYRQITVYQIEKK